jgi:hypothetical protein
MRLALVCLLLAACSGDSVTFGPDGPRWPAGSLPLRVALDADASNYSASLNSSIDWWEREVGRDLFVRVDGPADITVGIGSVQGSLVGRCVSGHLSARIELIGALGHSAALVLQHELGHALGLDHDPRMPASIMTPTLDVGLMAGEDIPRFVVTTADRNAVRTAYP